MLRENLIYWNWKSKVAIMQEGAEPLPRWDQYRMHMSAARILSTDRRISETRRQRDNSGRDTWRRHRGVARWNSVLRGKRENRWWRV